MEPEVVISLYFMNPVLQNNRRSPQIDESTELTTANQKIFQVFSRIPQEAQEPGDRLL